MRAEYVPTTLMAADNANSRRVFTGQLVAGVTGHALYTDGGEFR